MTKPARRKGRGARGRWGAAAAVFVALLGPALFAVGSGCAAQVDAPAAVAAPDAAADSAAPPSVDARPMPAKPTDCFLDLAGPVQGPYYDPLKPKMGPHCAGTQAQAITGVEKLVFLGDSITVGTPPTPGSRIYRSLVTQGIRERFGDVETTSCARWGARMDDLVAEAGGDGGTRAELSQCFPSAVEPKRTLVVMTMGGNDLHAWSSDKLDEAAGIAAADKAAADLRRALDFLRDPVRFPNGSYVIFGNVYEYTDTTGDQGVCPLAALQGEGLFPAGAAILSHLSEQMMKHAVETGTDMLFLLENFCGHGYRRKDKTLQCYRGEGAELWFDDTCIHPNPTGHAMIAQYVLSVVDGWGAR